MQGAEWIMWVIGILFVMGGGVSGIIYGKTITNSEGIKNLQLNVAKIPTRIVTPLLNMHEIKEGKMFDAINVHFIAIESKLNAISEDVAVIKALMSPNEGKK